ncbi:hypothetical protein [Streptomyces violaceusniger]|uniref:hypothetical protein n=1 Tax=Streptomyces violaceusniger TaxID=68280 RepID=UPI0038066C67
MQQVEAGAEHGLDWMVITDHGHAAHEKYAVEQTYADGTAGAEHPLELSGDQRTAAGSDHIGGPIGQPRMGGIAQLERDVRPALPASARYRAAHSSIDADRSVPVTAPYAGETRNKLRPSARPTASSRARGAPSAVTSSSKTAPGRPSGNASVLRASLK